ncbi:hypothetical protein Tco_1293649 [Tanacetum coccineum]
MHGFEVTKQVRHSRLVNEFEKFIALEGESLASMYERLITLINVIDQNELCPLPISINTKFLNSLQPGWSKHVTMTHQNHNLKEIKYDKLFDTLSQYEPHANASNAKKVARNHDPLALVAHSNVYSSQSHATGLGYQNPERLKKAIATQTKMYDGERLRSTKLIIDSPDSEETLEDAEESRLKMKDKMIQLEYEKLNGLNDTFVPQKEPSAEQAYFSTPSTFNVSSVLSTEMSYLPTKKIPNENKLDCMLMSVEKQKNEILMLEKEKISNDSNDIQAIMEQRIKILENDFKRAEAQYINLDLKMQHQNKKMACDVSWKSMMMKKLSDENVLLKTQVESIVQEMENIKLEFQKLFNSIKATRNQDLLMTISELKEKIKTIEKGKHVNTKFDKSETLGKLLCVTPLNKNKEVKAKKVSKTKVKTDKSKPVTSYSTPKNKKNQQHCANVITRGMYKIIKIETQMPVTKTNIFSSNSTGVASSSSVRIPESKDTNLKEKVLLNTKSKSTSTNVRKFSISVSVVSNKRETLNSTICQSNTSVLKAKTVNAVNDGSNLVCVSCGKDVFMLSHDKCVARYDFSTDSKVKRALFTSPASAKSRNL